jgi:hypothetical protein
LKSEIEEDMRRWKDLHPNGLVESTLLNDLITKTNLNVQQNPNDILQRNRNINLEIYMEIQKTFNSQRNSEQKIQY